MHGIILTFVLAYLIGSIPFGLILTKIFMQKDIRSIGSGNIGATNVLRTGNKLLAFFTLLLDAIKGVVAILLLSIMLPFGAAPIAIGLFAILGHCFPVWLKFKGGKGVASALGVFLVAVPFSGLVACAVWGIVAGFFRISSLAALAAMAIVPLATFLIYGASPAVVTIVIALLIFWRHKDNIQRLVKGEEPKIGGR